MHYFFGDVSRGPRGDATRHEENSTKVSVGLKEGVGVNGGVNRDPSNMVLTFVRTWWSKGVQRLLKSERED